MTPLVSINIPCYHQLEHARRCVASLRAQTLRDVEITLLDDGASDQYRDYVASPATPDELSSQPAAPRLRPIFFTRTAGAHLFEAFHEDDLLGSHYSRRGALPRRSSRLRFFAGDASSTRSRRPKPCLAAARPVIVPFTRPPGSLPMCFEGRPMFARRDRRSPDGSPGAPRDSRRSSTASPAILPVVGRDHPGSAGLVPEARTSIIVTAMSADTPADFPGLPRAFPSALPEDRALSRLHCTGFPLYDSCRRIAARPRRFVFVQARRLVQPTMVVGTAAVV